jgi:hypothetical protein
MEDLSIKQGLLAFSTHDLEWVLDHDDIEDVLTMAIAFSTSRSGTKEERLLAILHEDPNPSVRLKVLSEMMRHRDELDLDLDDVLVELILGHDVRTASVRRRVQSNEESQQEPSEEATVIEGTACEVLRELGHGALAAAYWLREHGESKESVAALSEVLTESRRDELTAVAGQALATIRSRLGEFAGGLALADTQAGALSVAAEQGQLSVAEEEAEWKRRAAMEQEKG